MKRLRPPVKFDRPPVVEVVCGVLFNDLNELRVPHIGLFWASCRETFPRTEERAPLPSLIESAELIAPNVQMEFVNVPPLPRVWLVAEDGRRLLQIQRDRFLFNWKRETDEDSYPSYNQIVAEFESWFAKFREFLATEKLGELQPRQYELNYINQITPANGLDIADKGDFLIDHIRQNAGARFLPEPEAFNWRATFPLPDKAGRLHMTAYTALRATGERVIRLDMTARGMPAEGKASQRAWFDVAHDWITHGFADATTPTLHAVWGRTQ